MSGLIKCFNTDCRDFSRGEVNNCSRPLQLIQECPEGKVRREAAQSSRLKAERKDKRSMTPEQRDRVWYIKEFKGNQCACGDTKRPGTSFCYICFKKLPSTYQHALYLKMGDGYEEAYEDAVEWLGREGV